MRAHSAFCFFVIKKKKVTVQVSTQLPKCNQEKTTPKCSPQNLNQFESDVLIILSTRIFKFERDVLNMIHFR